MRRLAILGAGGQLGGELRRQAADAWAVTGLSRTEIDARKTDSLRAVLTAARPAVVINCVALTQVDRCEDEPDLARQINATFAGEAAMVSAAVGARFVQVSTDFVFGGGPERSPIREDAALSPVNVYGRTKAEGEAAVLAVAADAQIVRVAALYGQGGASGKGGNFVDTMLRLARERESVSVVADQITSPTWAAEAARAILHLAETAPPGIYHAAGAGEASWFDLAEAAIAAAGLTTPVRPIATADYPTRAARPAYSALSTETLGASGFSMPPWRAGLTSYLAERAAAGL